MKHLLFIILLATAIISCDQVAPESSFQRYMNDRTEYFEFIDSNTCNYSFIISESIPTRGSYRRVLTLSYRQDADSIFFFQQNNLMMEGRINIDTLMIQNRIYIKK